MRLIRVLEHERIDVGPAGPKTITEDEALLLDRLSPHLPPGALNWERKAVKLVQFCGVIRAGDVTIEVLPKISDREPTRPGQLVQMLQIAGQALARPVGIADLHLQRLHLLDIFIAQFCGELSERLRQGMVRRYETREENATFVRGRIQLVEQLRRNALNRQYVYCRFDELAADNLYNQILKDVLFRLFGLAEAQSVRRRVNELLRAFDEVAHRRFSAADVRRLPFDRATRPWRPVFRYCEWLLAGFHPDIFAGQAEALSLLFDMNRLFENFVSALFRRAYRGTTCRIHLQGPVHALALDWKDQPTFPLRPDIVVDDAAGVRLIADAKWKRLDRAAGQYGIAAADVYQLVSYARRYACHDVALIYPSHAALPPQTAPKACGPVPFGLNE